jgi:hypothetical protein
MADNARYDYHNPDQPAPTSPYGSGDPYYTKSSGYIASGAAPAKGSKRNWLKIGIPIAILVIVGAVVGGVLGSRSSKKNDSNGGNNSNSNNNNGNGNSNEGPKNGLARLPTSTDPFYGMPIYPSSTDSALYSQPTFSSDSKFSWPSDTFSPGSPSPTSVRPDRPRIIAPAYKWKALPSLIATEPYFFSWNQSIFQNASDYYSLPPVKYNMDGPSGILDNAREIKMRIKAFAYAYRMSNNTKWADRAWDEIQNAASDSFGPATDKWNTGHFLDAAEFAAAYAVGYDWLYEVLTDDQKQQMRNSMIQWALGPGMAVFNGSNPVFGWWSNNVTGNWNCVCNGGLTLGALAILGDDTTGTAEYLLGQTIPNALKNCVFGATSDGTWTETANYWYFGTTGHAEMASSLLTATGSHYGLLDTNSKFRDTGYYHMYVHGPTSLFDYGDHGPNKFSTTANSVTFYGVQYKIPEYVLYQRDQRDSAEPWSMFWYDPSVSGAWWGNLPLDRFFEDPTDQWGSMRSSWTDNNALYIAMKAGTLTGHQTHNDLDVGDFVLDALNTRWAGELGSGDYNSYQYFTSDAQDAARWLYYRKRTEGQNTIVVGEANQLVIAAPKINDGTSGTTQSTGTTVFNPPSGSNAYFVADLSSAYGTGTTFSRGIRMLNKRRQVLLQDEITTTARLQWRMHTNATINTDGTVANLVIGSKKLQVEILNPPSGAAFGTAEPVRYADDPALPLANSTDQANPGVTVLTIDLPAGQYTLQVLFTPQWDGVSSSDYVKPSAVPLASWTVDSHP